MEAPGEADDDLLDDALGVTKNDWLSVTFSGADVDRLGKTLDETDVDWLGNVLSVTDLDGLGELFVGRVAVLVAVATIETETECGLFEAIVETEIN